MPDSLRRSRLLFLVILLNVAVIAGLVYLLRRTEPRVVSVTTPPPRPTPTVVEVMVEVSGAVVQPGVYTLREGARVHDALERAGGVLPEGDAGELNLARKVQDGEEITVAMRAPTPQPLPSSEAATTPATQPTPRPTRPARININTATVEQLDTLPGIGPTLAKRIVDYRTANGPFQKPEDIIKVRGIGEALYNDMKDLITVQ